MKAFLAWCRAEARITLLRLAITRAVHAYDNGTPDRAMRILLDALRK